MEVAHAVGQYVRNLNWSSAVVERTGIEVFFVGT